MCFAKGLWQVLNFSIFCQCCCLRNITWAVKNCKFGDVLGEVRRRSLRQGWTPDYYRSVAIKFVDEWPQLVYASRVAYDDDVFKVDIRELKQATFLSTRTSTGSESSRCRWRRPFLFEITNGSHGNFTFAIWIKNSCRHLQRLDSFPADVRVDKNVACLSSLLIFGYAKRIRYGMIIIKLSFLIQKLLFRANMEGNCW